MLLRRATTWERHTVTKAKAFLIVPAEEGVVGPEAFRRVSLTVSTPGILAISVRDDMNDANDEIGAGRTIFWPEVHCPVNHDPFVLQPHQQVWAMCSQIQWVPGILHLSARVEYLVDGGGA